MNIQRAENKIIEYPEIKEVNQKKLKKSIPQKWVKLGITSFIFEIIMRKSAFAVSIPSGSSGGNAVGGAVETNTAGIISTGICIPFFIASLIIFLVNIKRVIRIKKEQKKSDSSEKVKKSTKVLIIVSIVLMVISIIAQPTVEYILKNITVSR